MAVEGLVAEGVADLPGEVRDRMRAAGPPGLSPAAPLAVDACGSGLVVAALLMLLKLSGSATGLVEGAASLGGSTQGACGASTTGLRENVWAGAKAFVSKARRAGWLAVVALVPSAAAGAPASAPNAIAGG